MSLFKKKRYYFSDDSIASDTVIALVMSGISLLIELSSVVASIITKGHTPAIFGMLYVCAIILSLCGLFFGFLGMHAQEGGVKGKRLSVLLNILALVLPLFFIITYLL